MISENNKDKNMECIPEEATTAFDNQTYQSLNYHPQTSDSGFDSYEEVTNSKQKHPQKYENVDFDKTPEEKEPDETDFPSYENLEDEQSYENIEPPLNYQNIEFALPLPPPVLPPPTSLQSLPNLSHDAEAYENLQFQSLTETSPKIPVYAISTKKKNSAPIAMEEEEAPVYENYDFQEEAIYQNMLVNRTGKLIPAKVKNQQGKNQKYLSS